MKITWGIGIVGSFILFTLFIGVLVSICAREKVNLVSAAYYQEELAYQQQIDRINNTNDLARKPLVKLDSGRMEIVFGKENPVESGTVKLFRPSDSKLDKVFSIHPASDGRYLYKINGMPGGMYHVRITWHMNATDYFHEETITL